MGSLEGTFDTKLHEAVRYGDIEEVKNALQQGYDVNLIGLYQWSALHEAAYNGEEEILQLLLKHKGDPNKGDLLRGCTAVHYAAREGHVTCLRLLIKSGGCYDITNKDGETALDLAADECQDLLKSLKSENPTKVSVQRENNDLQLELKRPDTPEAISLGGASVTDSVSECDIQSIEKTHIKTPECSAEENLSKMVQFIVENISRVNKNDLKKLATSIGISQRQPILDDIKHTDCVKIENQLCNFNIQDWLHSRNEVLKSFVDGIAGSDDKIAKTAALDSLYYAVNPRFVSPLAFTRNLLVYFQTGSKSAVDILSYGTPSGSYYLITQWLKENAKSPLECQKEHDVVTFFDNNQVLQRKWNVQVNYKTQCSVITNIIHLTSGSCKLQFSEDLSPRHWMKFDMTERQHCYDALNKDVEECDTLFRQYRNEFIKSRLKLITSQQVVQHSSGTVRVKDFVENGTSIPSHTVASERYTFVGAEHPPKPVCCEMGEPCFENPCSYEAIQMVFNHIIEKTDVGKTRAWTMLGCDGLPYTLGSRLLEAIYRCECGQEYESELEFLQHREMFEHFASPVQECRKYRNLMLLPGLGHYEINMTKALFKLLWTVCLEDVGKMLGFNSPKALASCQNAAVLGYLQLSFEYHAKKKSLKIRVWQLSDLLLPPPNSSTVHSIYVKSFLMPDKKRDSKRKTEEVRVDSADTHLHIKKGGNRGSIQHVYSPATFKFSKPLEYSDISKEIVKDKSVQLEVCINQRYSKRSFLIGLYHIPLSSAVKKIVRDKYPVIPCVNPTIPTSMKVYNASQLTITNSAKIFYSNPNLRNTSLSSISNGSDRAISDPDFSIDIAYNQSISPSTSIELDEISDEEEKTLHDFCKRGTKLKSSHSNEARVIIPDTAVCKHSVDSNHETLKCVVDLMSSDSDKKMKLSAFSQVSENNDIRHSETFKKNASKHCQVLVGEEGTFESLQDDLNEKKQMIKVVGNEQEEKNPVGSNSRPETPTWDYYDMEMSAVEIPLQEVHTSANKEGSLAVYLPMETTLGLKTERRSKKGHVKHKKQKERTPVPGHAVPIIVVTPDDGADARFQDRNGEKSRHSKLTSDVFINMEFAAEDNPTRNVHTKPLKGESQLEVTADVHIDAVCRLNSETSIEIGDSDSFIIDLEENEDVTNENSNIQSKLAGGSAVPMTVFIDESCDSCDDVLVTGAVHSSHRFALNQNKDEHVSEV